MFNYKVSLKRSSLILYFVDDLDKKSFFYFYIRFIKCLFYLHDTTTFYLLILWAACDYKKYCKGILKMLLKLIKLKRHLFSEKKRNSFNY